MSNHPHPPVGGPPFGPDDRYGDADAGDGHGGYDGRYDGGYDGQRRDTPRHQPRHRQQYGHDPANDDTQMLPPAARGRSGVWGHVGRPDEHAPYEHEAYGHPGYEQLGYEHPGYEPRTHGQPTPGRPRRDPRRGMAPTRQARRRRERASGGVVIGRIASTAISVVLLAVSGLAWAAVGGTPHNASNATNQAGDVGVSSSTLVTTTDAKGNVVTMPVAVPPGATTGTGMNILIVGSDSRTDADGNELSPTELKALSTQWDGGGVSTDTLMILHVPGNGTKATAISIPRDTWITDSIAQAPGVTGPYSDGTDGPYKANKINSFYGTAMTYEREYLVAQGVSDEAELQRRSAEAGRTMLIKVLQQFTGIKIDHYAEVNLIGFYLLSNAIGGVPVCLLNPVKDRQSGATFAAGPTEVEGSQAMSFVRQRHGLPGGDLDRIRRQQVFLASAADKILSASTLTSPSKLAALVSAANRSLVLDNGFDLLSFAQQMMNLTSGNIKFTTIPTHGTDMVDGKSALVVNPDEVRAFFANLMTDKTPPSTEAGSTAVKRGDWTVDVQNGTETPGMAAQVGAVAAAAGFQRGQLTDYPGVTPDNQQGATTVRYGAGAAAAAAQLVKVLKVGSAVADDAVAAGHVLVVVGTDMPVLPPDQIPTATGAAPTTPTTGATSGMSTTMPSDAINAAHVACVN